MTLLKVLAGGALALTVCCSSPKNTPRISVQDIDGNVYSTVTIGDQVWTTENLRVTRYNDSTSILSDTSAATWADSSVGKFCFFNNTTNTDSFRKFGALYNWHAVNTKKLAPVGWHVPDEAEWNTLENYLITNGYNWDSSTDSNKIARSLAAKTDWAEVSRQGVIGRDLTMNNKSGFSALPGGFRKGRSFEYSGLGTYGCWWSATEKDPSIAYYRSLHYGNVALGKGNLSKNCAFSVRLVKD